MQVVNILRGQPPRQELIQQRHLSHDLSFGEASGAGGGLCRLSAPLAAAAGRGGGGGGSGGGAGVAVVLQQRRSNVLW